jgi:hypothetical protein
MFDAQFAHVPTDPPRRLEALPGLRFSAQISRRALLLPLLFLVFFIAIPLSIFSSDPAMRLAVGPRRTQQGRILSTADVAACNGSPAHRVVYAFSPDSGREFRGVATLCAQSPYFAATVGDAVQVQFVSSDPAVNALESGSRNNTPPVAMLFMMPLFILAVFSPMIVPQLRDLLRARRQFKKGRLALAAVVFIKKRVTASWPGWAGNSAAEVFVEFQPATGARREAVAWCPNDWLVNQLAPGAQVRIAYTDDTPATVTLLEAFLR